VQPLQVRSDTSSLTTGIRNGSSFLVTQFALPLLVRSHVPGALKMLRCVSYVAMFAEACTDAWCQYQAAVQAAQQHSMLSFSNDVRSLANKVFTPCSTAGGLLKDVAAVLLHAYHATTLLADALPACCSARFASQCAAEWGLFLIFAGCTAVGTLALFLLIPETRGLPLEEIHLAWASHWLWGRSQCVQVCADAVQRAVGSYTASAAPAGSDSSVKQLAQQGSKSCEATVDMAHVTQGSDDKA
jgi:hypothetical protein